MTRDDTIRILSVLRGAYPGFYRDISRQEAESTIALWGCMFEEPYEIVAAAVKAFISADVKGFPPAIGQIKEKILAITSKPEMNELEAWGYVSNALRNSAYGSREEFDKLPPEVQAAVHDPEQLRCWAMMESDEVQTVVASNFMRSFRARQKAQKEYTALPAEVKRLMIDAGFRSQPEEPGLVRLFGGENDAGGV